MGNLKNHINFTVLFIQPLKILCHAAGEINRNSNCSDLSRHTSQNYVVLRKEDYPTIKE